MRIVGGKYRNKQLWSPDGKNVRPTSERAREAVFNILYSHLGGEYGNLLLLDVFAGTGAFGFEALSRGFKEVAFVDIDVSSLQKNLKKFPTENEKLTVIKADAAKLPKARKQYDIIFADAPYLKGLTQKALQQLELQGWLKEETLCIVEIRQDEPLELPPNFKLLDTRCYGLAKILFLKYQSFKTPLPV